MLHGDEHTYSVVGSLSREPFRCGVLETYRLIARTLEAALKALGARARAAEAAEPTSAEPVTGPSCFQLLSPYEINVDGRKLVGSAQLRRRRAFLQHGSIPLRVDANRLAGALGRPVPSGSFIDLREATGRSVSGAELDRALCRAFESTFGITLRRGELSDGERLLATRLRCWKHDSVSWTLEARSGRRERRWGPLA